jgi:hypothetical protein
MVADATLIDIATGLTTGRWRNRAAHPARVHRWQTVLRVRARLLLFIHTLAAYVNGGAISWTRLERNPLRRSVSQRRSFRSNHVAPAYRILLEYFACPRIQRFSSDLALLCRYNVPAGGQRGLRCVWPSTRWP